MPQDMPPRMSFPIDVTEKEYVRASLLAARRIGTLRSSLLILVIAAVVLTIGLFSFSWFSSPLMPIVLCALGPLIALLFFLVEPAGVKKRAIADYPTYRAMMEAAVVELYPDHARTSTRLVTLTDPYALLVYCIETPDLLVFIKDRERTLVLPKRCLPAGKREETLEFLRLVFIRKRRVMRGWFL